MKYPLDLAAGSGGSVVVDRCQVCSHQDLEPVLFLGFMPPVNRMQTTGGALYEQPSYPAQVLYCPNCQLVQLGLIVDPGVLFPPSYPYTSGRTANLHRNFTDLAEECRDRFALPPGSLAMDIGSNDGTLLSKFKDIGFAVFGIEPTDAFKIAAEAGIAGQNTFFTRRTAVEAREKAGRAAVVTAANCFAHMENVHDIMDGVKEALDDDGLFVTENHYLISLLDTVQYDTIYHEHLRYYSLTSLTHLLGLHGFEPVFAKLIPTHGGSIRTYAARRGTRPVDESVPRLLRQEAVRGPMGEQLKTFARRTLESKLNLQVLLRDIKAAGHRIHAISAPSRASTLTTYVGLDDRIIDCVAEIKGSGKIGKNLPGTLIPVVEESRLFDEQPEYALLFAWHIADDLMPKLRQLGYKGRFIIPLPEPRIV